MQTKAEKRLTDSILEGHRLDDLEIQNHIDEQRRNAGRCPRHPLQVISTGGGTPMFDAPCPACEFAAEF